MNTRVRVVAAVVVLSQNSVIIGRKITNIFPSAKLYGLVSRTNDVDISFTNFGETVRELFTAGTPIIGICAAGILIRTIAPILTNKGQEPPILAIAEDGTAVVPLLGGLSGVNDLARQIAEALNIKPAITTTGDIRFHTALLSPPAGYHLANPEHGKKFIADLLAGEKVKLEGTAPWLSESNLPIDENSELTIQITEKLGNFSYNCLVYHPAKIAIALTNPEINTITQIQEIFKESNLAPAAVAGIFAPLHLANNSQLHSVAKSLGVPIRFFPKSELTELILAAAGADAQIVSSSTTIAVAISTQIINPTTIGQPQGKLAIIGTGPGASQWMSPQVKEILAAATDLVGYKTYINLIGSLADGKCVHESDNRVEAERAYQALELAATGKYVAVVSSGDPGIYAMAAAVFEVLDQYNKPEWQTIDIQVAPGISAMQAAAATIGAPLGHDFCVISLSDILKPWEIIAQRITAAATSDFVIAFYNPVSKERTWQLAAAKKILMEHRKPHTPVVLGRNLGRKGEEVKVITLEELEPTLADMRTVIIIGSSHTRQIQQDNNVWVYTSRRYNSEE
ncbi:precorrin-3B C(17)-methyltransferase [Dolichospermum sp. ST_sed1]|nr:precorrin-3B C(17)-methyltransferase [Dolichospermum sp. ST_sed1]MDD1425927.1 precorrin-3B C(17)-methyltransferase [Dolichospermum sp. ST_sed9]MDD1431964.1 precorrin-3B C(17)-methyltransferase [Dolichospermum sp. ST_sed6]MDD1435370.1 precorrin-3B C(17)-methyltransferase [Dolichospermum sp. ST_sed10]MDD1441784.1 precorrin-3B C(17)-methyltransferase [Dolichospermum sp. ST_sed3]MDD1445110.1 precorrin-3B C(17)-methyltransferase [Dolichospermum sp. ST_sed8]MDD1455861.1 precorrin-3B C(17)-methyl